MPSWKLHLSPGTNCTQFINNEKEKLEKEGGAIGQEDLADEMNDAEEGVELSVEKAMDGLKNKISNFFINKDGDAYIHDPEEGE